MRRLMIAGSMMLALSFVLVFAARAQDQGSSGSATPGTTFCATPVAEAQGTPATVVAAPTTAADPGGSEPGTPIGLFPCGTPEASPATGDQGSAGGQALSTSVSIEMVDIAFNPTEFTIPANTDVTVTLTNNGVAAHNFNIDELGIASGDVAGGASTTVTINAQPGTYTFYCSIPGHREAGMQGTITVQ